MQATSAKMGGNGFAENDGNWIVRVYGLKENELAWKGSPVNGVTVYYTTVT